MGHKTRSPSGAKRWSRCARAPQEEAKYPPKPSGEPAKDGTHTHTLFEQVNLFAGKYTAFDYVGSELTDNEGTFIVDQERAERVNFAREYIEARMAELPMAQLFAEKEVSPEMFIGNKESDGTCDAAIVWDSGIEAIDYKDGWGEVLAVEYLVEGLPPEEYAGTVLINGKPARLNEQNTLYLLGKVAEFIDASDTHPPFDVYRLTIIQPKLRQKGYTGITYVEVTWEQLLHVANYLRDRQAMTYDENAEFTPGAHCKWCNAEDDCKARAEWNLKQAVGDDEATIETAMGVVQANLQKDANELSAAEIAKFLDMKPLVLSFFSNIEEVGEKRHRAGDEIPGYGIKKTRTTESWMEKDEALVFKKFKNAGFKKAEYVVEKPPTPAAIRKSETYKGMSDKKKANIESFIKQTKHSKLVKLKPGEASVAAEAFAAADSIAPPPSAEPAPESPAASAPDMSFLL